MMGLALRSLIVSLTLGNMLPALPAFHSFKRAGNRV